MHLIPKLSPNLATSTNSVSTIVEETESQLVAEAELDRINELSTHCETILDILHPDMVYGSDSDTDKLMYADELLKDLNATKHCIHSTTILRWISYI